MNSNLVLKPIPVSPNDDYMAGSDGNIYSRTQYKGFGKKVLVDWYPLKGHVTKKGYVTITMSHEGKRVTKAVHRLVCMAFHGMPPTPSAETRHLDGNGSNNAPGNLCWGTAVENWQDKRAHGTATIGEKHYAAKFTDEERAHILWAISRGLCSQRHAARVLGVAQSSIQAIASAATAST